MMKGMIVVTGHNHSTNGLIFGPSGSKLNLEVKTNRECSVSVSGEGIAKSFEISSEYINDYVMQYDYTDPMLMVTSYVGLIRFFLWLMGKVEIKEQIGKSKAYSELMEVLGEMEEHYIIGEQV